MEPGTALPPLARHEIRLHDGRADLWECPQHALDYTEVLVAWGERHCEGRWSVWSAHPTEVTRHSTLEEVHARLEELGRIREAEWQERKRAVGPGSAPGR